MDQENLVRYYECLFSYSLSEPSFDNQAATVCQVGLAMEVVVKQYNVSIIQNTDFIPDASMVVASVC